MKSSLSTLGVASENGKNDGQAFNKDFRQSQVIRLLGRMGTILPLWINSTDFIEFSIFLERLCWRELGYANYPDFTQKGLDGSVGLQIRLLTTMTFSTRLSAFENKSSAASSSVSSNLETISTLLHLTPVEREWLFYSYCFSRLPMPPVTLSSEEHGLALIGALLGAPLKQMLLCTSPNRLRAMQLLDAPKYTTNGDFSTLNEWMRCSTRLQNILETSHPNVASLITAIRASEDDWVALEDHSDARLPIRSWLPPLVSESYLRSEMGQILTAEHIASMVNWICGWQLSADQFTKPLRPNTLQTLRENIKQKTIECSVANRPFTFHELMTAIDGLHA